MKPHSFLLIMLLGIACHTHAQTVTNVRFEQVNKQVKITYTLDKQADISVSVSENGGTTWHAPLKKVSGDVGKQVQPGSKTIYWDVLAEYDQLVGTNICFKITPSLKAENLTFTVNGVSFTMVYVEGGTFTMGATPEQGEDAYEDEKPAHQVTLSDYYMGKYEVTQELWQAIMGNNPSCFKKGSIYPVETVSWKDCQQFISKLNSLLSRKLGSKRFALPTEAQWEFAARGGNKSRNYKYAGSNNLSEVGWYDNNSDNKTHLVGQKHPNELGLYDMSGNVWEWCQDWYGPYSHTVQTNPQGTSSGMYHVCGGGSWCHVSSRCRVSYRGNYDPSFHSSSIGLRLMLIP
ncbi:MAG: formylglycine-generating enzyme family protein [Paludibacteraceae bacterium]